MWADVSLNNKTNILFINWNLTADSYQHEVLDMKVILLLRNHRGMQLLQDGAPAHRERATTAYLNATNVNTVYSPPPPPPPKSPDYVADFNTRNKLLTQKLLKQGYRYHKLRKTFSKFYRGYYDLISKFQVGLKSLLRQDFRNLISMVTWCIS